MEAASIMPSLLVMGVSGTGKSSVATALAAELHLGFVEGDDHHPRANIEKMSAGIPLDDDDRRPWLEELAGVLAAAATANRPVVLTCSALKRAYRDQLRRGAPDLVFVHLSGTREVLLPRMAGRERHFMPPELLDSQLATLEPLGPRSETRRVGNEGVSKCRSRG